jgi:drug/metabolite transporter (DMT)-like permease
VLSIVLAGVSAAVWGIADFSGGKASQRAHPLAVTVASQVLGLPVLVLALAVVPGHPTAGDLLWAAAAGIAGFGGIVLLYHALASGAMAVAAPVTAVTAAVIPIAVGLATDQVPRFLALAGAGCAVVAITLVSLAPGSGRAVIGPRLIGLSLTAGALFGVFFALLGQADEEAGMWPVVAARVGSLALGATLMLTIRTRWRLSRGVLPWVAAAGLLDIAANAFYVAAAARGHLSIVAAVASLYPVSTVILALTVDRERVRPVQLLGLALAATALVLVSI